MNIKSNQPEFTRDGFCVFTHDDGDEANLAYVQDIKCKTIN